MSTVKRRRYKRYKIKLAARLVVENGIAYQCMIMDFCSGGLFLELMEAARISELSAHQKIQVFFSQSAEQGGQEFFLEATIMHIRSNGLGVEFEHHSDAAFSALKREARTTTALVANDRRGNHSNASKLNKLETDFSAVMQTVLPAISNSVYRRAHEKLTDAAGQVENMAYANILLDATTNLKMNKEKLFDSFFLAVTENWHLILADSGLQEENETDSSLSLIDKTDFEDWLNLSVSIRNLESRFEHQLEQLHKKTAYLLETEVDRVFNPVSPAKLCDSFRDSFSLIEDDIRVKRLLYSVFEEILAEYLPDLYIKMEAILHRYGAPQKIAESSHWKNISPGSGNTRTQHVSVESTHDFSEHPGGDPVLPALESVMTVRPAVSGQEPAPIINVASNLLHWLSGQGTRQQNPHGTEQAPAEFSAEEINQALVRLQQNSSADDAKQLDTRTFQQQLLQTLKGLSLSDKKLSETDQNNLEVYERLFETLRDDMLLTQEMQTYLQRLHLPILSEALKNPGFLESENHPVRNVVNNLSWLESAVSDNKTVKNANIRQTLDDLIEKITVESVNNPAVFVRVEKQLNELSETVNKSIEHNIKRVTEVYEGKQKLEKARLAVQEEINKRLAGREIPEIVNTLLESGWQHALVICRLNDDHQAFQSHLGIIQHLISWLTGREQPTPEQRNTVLEFIDSQLQSVCTNTFLHSKIVKELSALLTDDTRGTVIPMIRKEITSVTHNKGYRGHEIEQLRTGEWLTFLLNDQVEPLKLVWIGEIENIYVFVNRSGIKKLELDGEELEEMIRTGEAGRIESLDVPIMDRATNMMLQKMHEKFIYHASHDPVTQLLNRKEFIKRLKLELNRKEPVPHLLCNIEIQDFRLITHACGLPGGDALLQQLTGLLKSHLRKDEMVARLDDKTFSILFKNCPEDAAETVAEKLRTRLIDCDFKWEDKSYAVAVSIGLVPVVTEIGHDIDKLLQHVDSATLSAKKSGRNRVCIFEEDDLALKSQFSEHEWAGRINQVLSEERLFLRCQKIAATDPEKSNHIHYEILLGIKDENDNIISPDDFIPAVERCRRMSEIDRWVVLTVFSWIEQHQAVFEQLDGFSINLSGESMNSEEFLNFLKNTLESSQLPLHKITFEITETVAAGSFLFVQKFIKQIKRFNCKFSLDDFGSGYSSYSYLKSLDVDYLKIDGAFVKDILNNDTDVAIVKSMNEIGHSLGLKTIAEYVENEEIQGLIREIGVDYVQGWGVQKPILLNELQ